MSTAVDNWWQLLINDDICWELMKMKVNLEMKFGTHITFRLWMKITFNFFFITAVISCQQLSTTVNSCQQLSTSVDSWWKWKSTYRAKIWHIYNFEGVNKNCIYFFSWQLSSAANSCWQLMAADDNENQPRDLKFGSYITFRVWMEIPYYYSFITDFIGCQQLLTADDICQEKKLNIIFIHTLKVICALMAYWALS